MRDNSLIGKAKELQVAALLAELGFQLFLPLVDKGYDLAKITPLGTTSP